MDFSLYNIDPPEFQIIERHESDNSITYDLTPALLSTQLCPRHFVI